ncbi:MAG: hypothetical protein IID58_14475 [Proteobacteria bacterium]|nr:hypothetical protein [Pseudomonadota bacterium]
MNDDTLILYYYNDGLGDRERRAVETALKDDVNLAAHYAELRQQLQLWSQPESHTVPTDMVQRWHDSIDRTAQSEFRHHQKPRNYFSLLSFAWGSAITAALAVGIGIGVYFSGGASTAPIVGADIPYVRTTADAAVPGAFSRGLQVHLRDTQRNIAAMPVATVADRTLLIMQIIQQNRIFERAADQHNSQGLARVLRAFEPILFRLAANDIAPEDAEALRRQLAFELKVMLTKLERDTSNDLHST